MSLDKYRESLVTACDVVVNALLVTLENDPRVTYAGYDRETNMFFVKMPEESYSFILVFPGEILPRDAGHA